MPREDEYLCADPMCAAESLVSRVDIATEALAQIANLDPEQAKEHAARIARKALDQMKV